MLFEEKKITLKNGTCAILKSPCVEDAEKMLNYIKTACAETDFLTRYPEEWGTSIADEEAWIRRQRSSPNTLSITCYIGGEIAGNCEINFGSSIKTAHRATIAIAILQDYWGLSLGTILFDELIAAARKREVELLELEFIEGNNRAQHLYEKFGFRIVSQKPNAFKRKDGTYQNEFCMQKYL